MMILGFWMVTTFGIAAPSSDYLKSVEAWRQNRGQGLRDPHGYLSLVALTWLKDGENPMGSDPRALVRLPKGFPGRVGTFFLEGQKVSLTPEPGVEVKVDGVRISGATPIEWQGEKTSEIRVGRLRVSVAPRNRGEGPRARVKDPDATLLKQFKGVSWFPVDEKYRVQARFEKLPSPQKTLVPNSIGTENDIVLVGTLTWQLDGKEFKLKAHEGEGGGLFVIFRDSTNGVSTYAAGRYLATEKPTADGSVELDFNRAYSPPCAFNKFTTCPYVPENRIPLAMEAGEKFLPGPR